jgi:hypothetical protein
LAPVFLSVAILGKAGGFSSYNALIVAAWITALIWFTRQWRAYVAEKSKTENEKPQAPLPAQTPQGPLPLPPGMKPMIGLQWPVRPGSRPAWPKLPKEQPATAETSLTDDRLSPVPAQPNQTSEPNAAEKKQRFVYERPTLPHRAAKLPNNWGNPNEKKAKNKKPKR